MIHIVTDGSVDFPQGWAEKYQIHVLPIMVRFGNRIYTSGVDLPPSKFYQMVIQTGTVPKTSLPSPGEIADFYRSIAKKGETILSIHVSSKLSGTYSAVVLAAREVEREFNVTVFDSCAGSIALGFMCREARIMENAGYNIQAIVDRMETIKKHLTVIFTLDTLEFAHMNGRVTGVQSLFGSLMNIKPVVMLQNGLFEIVDKVRTRNGSIQRVLEIVESRIGSDKPVHMAVVQANDLPTAMELSSLVRQRFTCREVVMSELAIPVAANLGPGTIGIVTYPDIDGI
jgi:DegV family protein with EDD domain